MTKALQKVTGASWRTTVCGLMVLLGVLFETVGIPLLDSVAETGPDWSKALEAVAKTLEGGGIFGGLFNARDHKVSSEQAGAKSQPEEPIQ